MSPIDGLLGSIDLLRSSLAVEIAKALAPSSDDGSSIDAPEGYAKTNPPQLPIAQTLTGLRPPIAVLEHTDPETLQTLLQNLASANSQSSSATTAILLKQLLASFPGMAAAQQGFAEQDAGQLLASEQPPDRLSDTKAPLSQQLTAAGSRSEFWEGLKAASPSLTSEESARATHAAKADHRDQLARDSLQETARGDGASAPQNDAAARARDANNVLHAALAASTLDMERTGIIASSLLNAAMIPGWPYQKATIAGEPMATPKFSDEEALAYLANLGADEELVEKLRKRKPTVGKKLLIHLATLLTALETVMEAVATELALLAGVEQQLADKRAGANTRGKSGSRRRLYVE